MKINALVVGASKGLGKEVLLLHRDLKHSVIGISRSGKNNGDQKLHPAQPAFGSVSATRGGQ